MLRHVSRLRGQTKGNNNGYSQLTCLILSMKRDNMKLPPSVIDSRGGVLEDVIGLKDTFWNPWPRMSSSWSRSLHDLKNALSSVEDSTTFWVVKNGLWSWPSFFFSRNFAENLRFWRENLLFRRTPEISRKICEKTIFLENTWHCVLAAWPRALCPRLHL